MACELFVLTRQVLYQRDGEIIALARPDLAVSESGSSSVAQLADSALALVHRDLITTLAVQHKLSAVYN